jgi:hypothetical protein
VTAGIAIVLAAVHILLTAVFNLPYQSLKYGPLPGELADSYINPYLSQDYRIFAPDPANADRNLWVRAWVATPDGERVVSQWVDTTAVELAEPYRRVLRKQLTVLGAERLMILAIQTRSVYSPVVRWGDRHDESAVAPPDTYTDLGWRPVMEWPEQDRDAFARTFLAWAEDAGLSLDLEPREPTTVDELPAGDIDAAQSDDVTAPATSGADDD